MFRGWGFGTVFLNRSFLERRKIKQMDNSIKDRYSNLYEIYFDFPIESVQPYLHTDGNAYVKIHLTPCDDEDDTLTERNELIDEIDRLGGSNERIPSDNPTEVTFRLI